MSITEPIPLSEKDYIATTAEHDIPKRDTLEYGESRTSIQTTGSETLKCSIEGWIPLEPWVDDIQDLKDRYENEDTIDVDVFGDVIEFNIDTLSYSYQGGYTEEVFFELDLSQD